jgi:hypothetical protein
VTDGRTPGQASSLRRMLFPLAWGAVERLRLEPFVGRRVVPRLPLAEPSAATFARMEERVEREVARLAATDGPILVGPYLSEVGLELLYWLPFLRRLVRRHRLAPERLVAVSRGGVASWYEGICGNYVDVFELLDEAEFRAGLEECWTEQDGQKQFQVSGFDRRVTIAAAERLGMSGVETLHPSLMFGLFSEYWLHRIALAGVLGHVDIDRLTPPRDAELEERLPPEYVAARFYFRETFPDTPENRELVARTLGSLADGLPVVLLDTDLVLDDHSTVPLPEGVTVARPLAGRTPEDNLHAQSVVLSRASAFVGTYGGLVYLANAYGVPAFGLFTPPAVKLGLLHTALARRLADAASTSLSVIPTSALAALAAEAA